MRRIWSAVTCYRFRRPRLVAATFGKHKPRGDKSPHTKALTSQRTPHATRPLPRPLSQWERGENLSRSKQQPKPRRHGVKEIDVIGGGVAHCPLFPYGFLPLPLPPSPFPCPSGWPGGFGLRSCFAGLCGGCLGLRTRS